MPHRTQSPPLNVEDCPLEPIAIVGQACRLPGGIDTASALWEVLINKKSVKTPKVPKSRFNIDAHLHQNLERPGSFNAAGGYFLEEDLEDFDPTFFGITPIEAMWMDPQHRKMLEVSYECLESAGLTLNDVDGTNTAVFVGTFTNDFQQMCMVEKSFRHTYAATGVDPGIVSNRIGNTFNLKGPSFTINTACSSSIYAIHNACHALRAQDCEAAIAGGVNLILTVDQHMNTAKMGVLSPTSTCHTFDESADGYGRAEGVGALYLKRLSDAIRDGNPVRGVIRTSAVNTNGKVAGMAISYPGIEGQERVIRQAYKRSNLDPNRTIYAECHGTGTAIGDPIEVRAVTRAMNDNRSTNKPLIIGAVKANIGHSEAASGIFAVMKAALMTEAGVIPGVCGLKKVNPKIPENEWNVNVNRETRSWPEDGMARRAGVSSFGYGGTNGHVIVEEVNSLYPSYEHGKPKSTAHYDHSSSRPFLVSLSAHDKTTLTRNIEAHAKIADKFYLADLAYTLSQKRTLLSHRAFSVVREGKEAENFTVPAFKFGAAPQTSPDLAFIFTGQGAQYAGMAIEAIQTFPRFAMTIDALDSVLRQLKNPPSWSLRSAISAIGEKSNLGDAEIAQPATTAIQIAMIDLFASWKIFPTVSVGHSSGEIGAAYAAGFISAPEAIIAAYYRGYAVKKNSPSGTMLAVGLGVEEVSKYIDGLADVVIACENSPASVTLSGTSGAIQVAKERLDADQVFARELKTGKAYHSPQMEGVAIAYDALLADALSGLGWSDREWRQPKTRWISSVTGKEFDEELTPQYWSRNLRNRVMFNSAITSLGNDPDFENVRCVLELGPHSVLKGPLMEIFKANKFERFTYIATLLRKADSSDALLGTAGSLWVQNHTVDLQAVNAVEYAPHGSAARIVKTSFLPLMLVDLPRYQWNYEKSYWAEPRASHEQRNLKYARHDVLGMRGSGLADDCLVWYNHLRHKDLPWLQDHRLGNVAVFPAAGHLSLAIEAVRQISELQNLEVKGVSFRDVAIDTALVIPETEDGIEIQFHMTPIKKAKDSSVWYSFTIESVTDGVWTKHCEGTVCPLLNDSKNINGSLPCPVDVAGLQQRVPSRRWYKAFDKVGFEYGSSFQKLGTIRSDGKNNEAAADVEIVTECGLVQGESRYILHPATIDSCLHLMIISTVKGLPKELTAGIVPLNIEQMSIWLPTGEETSTGNAIAWADFPQDEASRHRNCHMKLCTESGNLVLEIQNMRTVRYEAAIPQKTTIDVPKAPYMQTSWKPDITTMGTSNLNPASLTETLELLDHKQALKKVAFVGWSETSLQQLLPGVSSETEIMICDLPDNLETMHSTLNTNHRISTCIIKDGSFSLSPDDATSPSMQDVVVLNAELLENAQETMLSIKNLLGDSGQLIAHFEQDDSSVEKLITAAGFSPADLQFASAGKNISIHSAAPYMNGVVPTPETITLLAVDVNSKSVSDLVSSLTNEYRTIEVVEVDNFDKAQPKVIVVDDGSVLSSLTERRFDCLKKVLLSKASIVWITSGVNEGKNVDGSMVQGFLRAIRSEQATSKIALLDVDRGTAKDDISRAVLSKLKYAATKDSGADTEFWLHNGALHINRVVPNVVLNEMFQPEDPQEEPKTMPSREALKGALVDGEMIFGPYDRYGRSINAGDVEIQVSAAEFDLPGTGNARLVSGTVLREGSEVSPSMVGKEIIMYAMDSYSTILRAPASHVVPTSGLVAANLIASLPRVARAWNAIVNVGKIQAGEHVLLLHTTSAMAGVISTLASIIGFKLTVAIESEQEEVHLTAQGVQAESFLLLNGADSTASVASFLAAKRPQLVLAHDFGAMSRDIWRIMPAMSRFVLHDAEIVTAPDVRPFVRGAAFLSTGIQSLLMQDPTTLRGVLKSSIDCWSQRKQWAEASLIPISSLKDAARVGEAKLANNAVITYAYDNKMEKSKIRAIAPVLRLDPDATYLLVGCLGGLGRSLTARMMERGAQSFAFISRSGDDKPDAARVVANIRNAGLEALVYRADAADEGEVAKVLKSITRPIRGVVHAAMVLQDTMFERMTYDKFNAAVMPKVQGAKALENALEKEGKASDLDFFVMTSSISAQIGNPSQSNYSAANSFLDGLARSRDLRGLPGVSLVIPMVLDVGVVAENENIEISLTRQAMYGIDEREMLRGFETAMMQSLVSSHVPETTFGKSEIVLGFEPAELSVVITPESADSYWLSDCRFKHVIRAVDEIARANGSGQEGGESNFSGQLKAAIAEGPEVVVKTIASHVMERCARILMLEVEDFSFDEASISSYGLDSMIGAELRNWLFKEFGLDISFQHLLAPTMTFKKLATTIGETMDVLGTS